MSRRRRFHVTLMIDVEITVDAAVIGPRQRKAAAKAISPQLGTERGAIEHLAYNAVINGLDLPQIDGFANLGRDRMHVSAPNCVADGVVELPARQTQRRRARSSKKRR